MKTCDPLDVFVFRPLTSPRASEREKGISVRFILDGFVISPKI